MGKSVKIMGMNVFEGCTNLTSINIPNSLNTIPECTFYKCTSLKSITLPNSVTTIESAAFEGCTSLTSIRACSESLHARLACIFPAIFCQNSR